MSQPNTVQAKLNGQTKPEVVDPAVVPKPTRRRFSAEYKLRVLREADACREPGQIGALLRREGLYASHLTDWRRQREAGAQSALGPKKRGRKPTPETRVLELERENTRLIARLKQAEMIIDSQKKLCAIFGSEATIMLTESGSL